MRVPESLQSLVYDGIVDQVVRPLMSGKEAQVYLVLSGGYECVAKIYKDAQNRSFQNRATYTEGRKVRNTRDQRAMEKRTRHGKAQDEAAWRNTEVDMIYRLRSAGVRVPIPHHYIDGVLIMELVCDAEGEPAPRLGDVQLEAEEAQRIFEFLLSQVQRMLCAGVVHGDLSDFNVLLGAGGPVIIDFPQSVHASNNQNARKLLLRDVNNLHRFMGRFVPEYRALPFAEEMWHLYERNQLTPDTKLSGRFQRAQQAVNTSSVLGLIGDASRDERRRREARGLNLRGLDAEGQVPQARDAQPQREHGNQDRAFQRDAQPQQQRARASQDRGFQRDAQPQRAHTSQDRGFQRDAQPQQPQRAQERAFHRDAQPQQQRARTSQDRSFQRDAQPQQQRAHGNQDRGFQRDSQPQQQRAHTSQERGFQRDGVRTARGNYPPTEVRGHTRPRLDAPLGEDAAPRASTETRIPQTRFTDPRRERPQGFGPQSTQPAPHERREHAPSQAPSSRASDGASLDPAAAADEAERKRRRRRRRRSGPKAPTV